MAGDIMIGITMDTQTITTLIIMDIHTTTILTIKDGMVIIINENKGAGQKNLASLL
jgi:hypothetical protein